MSKLGVTGKIRTKLEYGKLFTGRTVLPELFMSKLEPGAFIISIGVFFFLATRLFGTRFYSLLCLLLIDLIAVNLFRISSQIFFFHSRPPRTANATTFSLGQP